MAATLQRKSSGGIIFVTITKIITKKVFQVIISKHFGQDGRGSPECQSVEKQRESNYFQMKVSSEVKDFLEILEFLREDSYRIDPLLLS